MKQILIIHGGNSFKSYGDYLQNLKDKEVSLERMRYAVDWKDDLSLKLKGRFDVLTPRMPCADNARFCEWKIWFQRVTEACDQLHVLIGHSLGGIFLSKYLSEEKINNKIEKTILISAPFKSFSDSEEGLDEFTPPESLELFEKQSKEIILFHSKDDPIVPFEHLDMYGKKIPKAKTMIFKDRAHFKQETFPELLDVIEKK